MHDEPITKFSTEQQLRRFDVENAYVQHPDGGITLAYLTL